MFVALPKTVLEYDESLPLCFQNGNDVGWRREMKWVKAEMPTMRRKKRKLIGDFALTVWTRKAREKIIIATKKREMPTLMQFCR